MSVAPLARTFSGPDIDGPGPARATDGPVSIMPLSSAPAANVTRDGIFTCFYGLKRLWAIGIITSCDTQNVQVRQDLSSSILFEQIWQQA